MAQGKIPRFDVILTVTNSVFVQVFDPSCSISTAVFQERRGEKQLPRCREGVQKGKEGMHHHVRHIHDLGGPWSWAGHGNHSSHQ